MPNPVLGYGANSSIRCHLRVPVGTISRVRLRYYIPVPGPDNIPAPVIVPLCSSCRLRVGLGKVQGLLLPAAGNFFVKNYLSYGSCRILNTVVVIQFPYSDNGILLQSRTNTWTIHNFECVYEGGTLASIKSEGENEFIRREYGRVTVAELEQV